jgi:hypothetical protein
MAHSNNPWVNSNEQFDVVIQTFPQRLIPFEAMTNHVRVGETIQLS